MILSLTNELLISDGISLASLYNLLILTLKLSSIIEFCNFKKSEELSNTFLKSSMASEFKFSITILVPFFLNRYLNFQKYQH